MWCENKIANWSRQQLGRKLSSEGLPLDYFECEVQLDSFHNYTFMSLFMG